MFTEMWLGLVKKRCRRCDSHICHRLKTQITSLYTIIPFINIIVSSTLSSQYQLHISMSITHTHVNLHISMPITHNYVNYTYTRQLHIIMTITHTHVNYRFITSITYHYDNYLSLWQLPNIMTITHSAKSDFARWVGRYLNIWSFCTEIMRLV